MACSRLPRLRWLLLPLLVVAGAASVSLPVAEAAAGTTAVPVPVAVAGLPANGGLHGYAHSRPVAGGGRVVVELVQGTVFDDYWEYSYRTEAGLRRVFYREPHRYGFSMKDLRPYEEVVEYCLMEEMRFGKLVHDEQRLCLFLPDADSFTVVTLELPPAEMRVRVDTFPQAQGFGRRHAALVGVNELELSDDRTPEIRTLRLRHAADGTWLLNGKHWQGRVASHSSTTPLPPIDSKDIPLGGPDTDRMQRYHDSLRPLWAPMVRTGWIKSGGWIYAGDMTGAADRAYGYGTPGGTASRKWLLAYIDDMAAFSPQRGYRLRPTLELGPDLEMPTMLPKIRPGGFEERDWRTDEEAVALFLYDPWVNHGWITLEDLDLPWITSDYHDDLRSPSPWPGMPHEGFAVKPPKPLSVRALRGLFQPRLRE